MSRLAINLITRSRPEILARTIETTVANMTRDDTLLMVSVDEDDEATRAKLKWLSHPQVLVSVKPREDTLGEKYNRVLVHDAAAYCNLSDYNSFTAKGFDEKILDAVNAFPDGYGLVVNKLRNLSFPDIFVMTKKLATKLGYYAPPLFTYWFWDHWVDDLAQLMNRRIVVNDVEVTYDKQGKPPTMGLREPAWWATFFDCAYLLRRATAHAIVDMDDFDDPPWRKRATKSMHSFIELRSKWINDNVRAGARDMEWAATQGGAIKPDERYIRVRTRAAQLVPQLVQSMPPEEAQRWMGMLLPPMNVVNIPRVGA